MGDMSPLRRLLQRLFASPETCPALHWQPFEEPFPPQFTEHERLMRHTGSPECPIPDHADALRRLGQVLIERDELALQLTEARFENRQQRRVIDTVQTQLRAAEAKLPPLRDVAWSRIWSNPPVP